MTHKNALGGMFLTPEQQMAALHMRLQLLMTEMTELRKATSPHAIKAMAREVMAESFAAEKEYLHKLTNDSVRILSLLVDKGLVTREELNAAVGSG